MVENLAWVILRSLDLIGFKVAAILMSYGFKTILFKAILIEDILLFELVPFFYQQLQV